MARKKKVRRKKLKLKTPKTRLDFIIPVRLKSALVQYCNATGQTMVTAIVRAIRELIDYKEL
jgi:hypothetical protein